MKNKYIEDEFVIIEKELMERFFLKDIEFKIQIPMKEVIESVKNARTG